MLRFYWIPFSTVSAALESLSSMACILLFVDACICGSSSFSHNFCSYNSLALFSLLSLFFKSMNPWRINKGSLEDV